MQILHNLSQRQVGTRRYAAVDHGLFEVCKVSRIRQIRSPFDDLDHNHDLDLSGQTDRIAP